MELKKEKLYNQYIRFLYKILKTQKWTLYLKNWLNTGVKRK